MARYRIGYSIPVLVAALVTATVPAETVQRTESRLPRGLEQYVTSTVRLAADDRNRLIAGEPVRKLLDGDDSKEIGIFGSIWIAVPIRRYVEAVKDIERLESGHGFRVTKRISNPPRIEDFAALRLPDEDLDDLKNCRVGDCEIKLGEGALRRFRSEVDWKASTARATADAVMRQLAFEYVTGYLEGGNERLAVYRDNSRPTFVAHEFREMIDQMPELTTYMPSVRRDLLEYPKVTLPAETSFLYWQEADFGLKPMIRISHLTIREGPEDTVVTSKMLYASHYFWTGLEIRALIPDPSRGVGFWFVTVNRSRSDGLSGFTGAVVRRHVRGAVQDGTLAALTMTKQMLEASR